MKKILQFLLIIFVSSVLISLKIPTAFAAADLTVDWGVPNGSPIFTISNILPGDLVTRTIQITNTGTVPHAVTIKGTRTGGSVDSPRLETVLDFVIEDGTTPVYGQGSTTGPRTLLDFFTESEPSGIILGNIDPNQTKTFNFTAYFPTSAGNEFQQKQVIFKLEIPNFYSNNIVINEVYYNVAQQHWVHNHGQHWYNLWGLAGFDNGDREHDDCESDADGAPGSKCNSKAQNDEWVELYNSSDHEISLKNWTLTDNSSTVTIHSNTRIKAHGFALISKDSHTWKFWDEDKDAAKIELGKQIGNGLNNSGDHLILKDNNGNEIDRMSWGDDISGFTPNAVNPLVSIGNSTERLYPGFDTDMATDWEERDPPTPGH